MYEYSEEDYQKLKEALHKAQSIAYGRPDIFQYYQNELSHHIANFLLKGHYQEKSKPCE
jgi:hypothetical protein